MNKQITVVGSINMDLVIRVPRMPLPGETLAGGDFHVIPGGKGANQAVAAARLGGSVAMIGRVGGDDFGRRQQEGLRRDGIDLSRLSVDEDCATGIAMITVDESGQNSIIISPEANGRVSATQVEEAAEGICRANMLLCQLEVPIEAVTRAVDIAHAHQVAVALNPAPAARLDASLLEKVSYFIVNETEAEFYSDIQVTDRESAKRAAQKLQQSGIETVLVTLGEKGVLVAHNGEFFHEDALSVQAVDTTAAGDTFVGAFSVAMTAGRTLREAVMFASHAAALTVTRLGAQSSIPTYDEVAQFLKERQ
ncbi:ribokinase [candidate division KSB3 bacterium]|uniref:Ribokinase n=1 Tax=candidate division KSB3 bacterium TaxID=2044937 RepID=A0A2G6E778_9BACT|nr:MAG: ribokinase [candidate division KSB3 bacterium]PIE30110.1 MAG: ribokinase [candidate division KSB3 bacterium]